MNFFTLVNIMFRRILLENFKTFGKTEMDLTDGNLGRANHVALLYGPNGSGKSSVIDAVAFLKLSALTLESETDVRELASSARRYGSDIFTYSFTINTFIKRCNYIIFFFIFFIRIIRQYYNTIINFLIII